MKYNVFVNAPLRRQWSKVGGRGGGVENLPLEFITNNYHSCGFVVQIHAVCFKKPKAENLI